MLSAVMSQYIAIQIMHMNACPTAIVAGFSVIIIAFIVSYL